MLTRTQVGDRALGALRYQDDRDRAYPITELRAVSTAETRGWRYWYDLGISLDQGREPICVETALWHLFLNGPDTAGILGYDEDVPYEPPKPHKWLYCEAQKRDPWEGDCEPDTLDYDGTSVRSGAKALHHYGYLREYRWCENLDETIRTILNVGPVVLGSIWYQSMSFPDEEGYITVDDSQNPVGGHAYVLNGVNVDRGVFRLLNSWGKNWGDNGRAWLPFSEFEKLLDRYVEICVPLPASAE